MRGLTTVIGSRFARLVGTLVVTTHQGRFTPVRAVGASVLIQNGWGVSDKSAAYPTFDHTFWGSHQGFCPPVPARAAGPPARRRPRDHGNMIMSSWWCGGGSR